MVRQHDVAVVVDSCSCLPPELLQQWDITVAPHEITADGRTYRDGVDLHPEQFYKLLKMKRGKLTTAPPRPQQFLEAFIAAGKLAPNVLCLTISSKFSAAYQSARAAAVLAGSRMTDVRVEVVDSLAVAGASGLIALAAARWAAKGYTMEQVISEVDQLIPKVDMFAFLESLHYLGRSGRVGKLQVWTGSILRTRPLTELKLGEARILEKPRSRAKAMQRLLELMGQRVGRSQITLNVMEADSREDAEALLGKIRSEFNCREAILSECTPAIGAYTGPGLLGVAFYMHDGDEVDKPENAHQPP
ncbi:MAG: DegV family protein [Chloroflexi bacterium]|nr:DegV family protein [Chloroflexota bacterium]